MKPIAARVEVGFPLRRDYLRASLASWSTGDILSGRGELSDFLMIGLPVLYAWLEKAKRHGDALHSPQAS